MSAARLAAAALVVIAALLAILVWRQETRIALLEQRQPLVAPSPRPPAQARMVSVKSHMRLEPAAARRVAITLGPRVLELDAAGVDRLARFVAIFFAHEAQDRLRAEGGKMTLDDEGAQLATLDLATELDNVGLTPAQRRKLYEALPALRKALPATR